MADLTLDPSLGIAAVRLVDDDEEVAREAPAWLLHSRRLPLLPDLPHRPWRRAHRCGSGQWRLAGGA